MDPIGILDALKLADWFYCILIGCNQSNPLQSIANKLCIPWKSDPTTDTKCHLFHCTNLQIDFEKKKNIDIKNRVDVGSAILAIEIDVIP